ncbi:hypothetical protein MSG28_008260, partial [Choristoneura fumiferana]
MNGARCRESWVGAEWGRGAGAGGRGRHSAGSDDAEENQARVRRGRRRRGGGPVTRAPSHAPRRPAGDHAQAARQGAAPQHGAVDAAAAAAAATAARHLNLAQRAPHLALAPASGSRPARAPGARCRPAPGDPATQAAARRRGENDTLIYYILKLYY